MSNVKVISMAGIPFTADNLLSAAGFEILGEYIQAGYRHFILDLTDIEFGNTEDIERIGMILVSSYFTTQDVNATCVIVKPQGMLSNTYGIFLEAMMPDETWQFTDTVDEAMNIIPS